MMKTKRKHTRKVNIKRAWRIILHGYGNTLWKRNHHTARITCDGHMRIYMRYYVDPGLVQVMRGIDPVLAFECA